jgi:hypothetical protein
MPDATLLLLDAPPPMPDPVIPLTIVAGRVRRYAAGETLAAALLPGALPGLAGAAYPPGTLLGGAGGGVPAALALGAGLTLAGGTLSAAGGGGGGSGALDPTVLGALGWAEGDTPTVLGAGGHAEGYRGLVTDDYGHAEGYASAAGVPAFAATIAGTAVNLAGDATAWFADGAGIALWALAGGTGPTAATGAVAGDPAYDPDADATTLALAEAVTTHAAGRAAVAGTFRWAAHAEGYAGRAYGFGAHAEGTGGRAVGQAAHAEGNSTRAGADAAHAEGFTAVADGSAAHAEGSGTVAAGYAAHAEGDSTVAGGYAAHAEGVGTAAAGQAAHAEGSGTAAVGQAAHAEGDSTRADADAAHAEGHSAVAGQRAQHAHASGAHAVAGDTQYSRLVLAAAPADATPTRLLNGDGAPALVRPGGVHAFRLFVLGKAADGTAAAAVFQRQGLAANRAGTTTLLGTPAVVGADLNDPGWGLAIAADDAADALAITVAGAPAAATRWVAVLEMLELID